MLAIFNGVIIREISLYPVPSCFYSLKQVGQVYQHIFELSAYTVFFYVFKDIKPVKQE